MEDRYFDHIVGCLRDAHERADNGRVKVTDDLVFRSMYLLKEQQARIERLEDQPQIVHCPDCLYNKTCINTTNGIDPYGFCKWGKKDGDDNG